MEAEDKMGPVEAILKYKKNDQIIKDVSKLH
jgi:hypothetical protein